MPIDELHICEFCSKNVARNIDEKTGKKICNRCLDKINRIEAYKQDIMNGLDPSVCLDDYDDISYEEMEHLYAGLVGALEHRAVFQETKYNFLLLSCVDILKKMKFKDFIRENEK